MIAMLTVMSDMDFHTISGDMVGWFLFWLDLVGLVHGMQQV
jgi:hypothetical protein